MPAPKAAAADPATTAATSAAAAKPKAKTAAYKVLSPIQDGADSYEIGEEIELPEKQAAELVACGALEAL